MKMTRGLLVLLCLVAFAITGGYGQCKNVVKEAVRTSKWCDYTRAPAITTKPVGKGTVVGRQTVFAGPLGHVGYCKKPLFGSATMASVALSTKYLGGNYRGVYPDPACNNRCICVMIRGYDPKTSTDPYHAACLAPKYVGVTFRAQVIEQCSECEDEHIDMLADAPWTSNPDNLSANARFAGKRILDHNTAWSVGTFVSEWGFARCNADCTKFFGAAAIKNAKAKGPKPPAYCK